MQTSPRREKQELFTRKAMENDQMQQKHLLSKMETSYGRTKYLATTIQNHSFTPCGICSPKDFALNKDDQGTENITFAENPS